MKKLYFFTFFALLQIGLWAQKDIIVLWSQSDTADYRCLSQNVSNNDYDTYAADDFIISPRAFWCITGLGTFIDKSDSDAPDNFTVNLYFYENTNNKPGNIISSKENLTGTYSSKWFSVDFSSDPIYLQANQTYWVCIQINGDDSYGYYLIENTSNYSNQYVWKNPGNGWNTGATDWTFANVVNPESAHDIAFNLYSNNSTNIDFSISDDQSTFLTGANVTIEGTGINFDFEGFDDYGVDLPNGEYYYTITKEGYQPYYGSFVVDSYHFTVFCHMTPTDISEQQNNTVNYTISNNIISINTYLKNFDVEIRDIQGKTLLEKKNCSNQSTIDINSLPDGIYIFRIISKNTTNSFKIIK